MPSLSDWDQLVPNSSGQIESFDIRQETEEWKGAVGENHFAYRLRSQIDITTVCDLPRLTLGRNL